MKKQFTIGIVFGFLISLAIAAFPPQWNGSQFQSIGGVFSHTNNGNLGTNRTVFNALLITNNPSVEPTLTFGTPQSAPQPGNIYYRTNGEIKWRQVFGMNSVSWYHGILESLVFEVYPSGNMFVSGYFEPFVGITNRGWYHGTGILTNVADIKTGGNLIITTAGKGLQIKTGANAKMGKATMVNGTVTVSTTAVTADSHIFLTKNPGLAGSQRGALGVGTITAATSFVIRSDDIDGALADDDSVVAWMIVEPAP